MRRAIPLSLIAALMTCAAIGAQAASASPFGSAVVGHVYVNDNTATTNTIAGFARHADGGLTPLQIAASTSALSSIAHSPK